MKTKEIRELSAEELSKKLRDMREELLNLNVRKGTGQVETGSNQRAAPRYRSLRNNQDSEEVKDCNMSENTRKARRSLVGVVTSRSGDKS